MRTNASAGVEVAVPTEIARVTRTWQDARGRASKLQGCAADVARCWGCASKLLGLCGKILGLRGMLTRQDARVVRRKLLGLCGKMLGLRGKLHADAGPKLARCGKM